MQRHLARAAYAFTTGILFAFALAACGGGSSAPAIPLSTSTPSTAPSSSPATSVTQSVTAAGATVNLPVSGSVTGASVTFPASTIPSGVSATFSAASTLNPPTAQHKRRATASPSALAFWQLTFSGSSDTSVAFNGSITLSIPTPSGSSGLLLEIFNGTELASTCASSASGGTTTFACANANLNLTATYWIEIVASSALAAGCIVPIGASPAGPHLLYYTDEGHNVVDSFDVCAQPASGVTASFALPSGTLSTSVADGGEIRFDRGSSGADPRVFVLGANNTIVYMDVSSAAGTVLQTLTFTGTPHHFAVSEATVSPEILVVTVGNTTVQAYTVSETSPYLTLAQSNAGFSSPRGISLEGEVNGTRNDAIVANYGNGTIAAVDTATLAIDSTVSVGGEPQRVTGPNGALNCALVTNASNDTVDAVSAVQPGGTIAQIGSALTLPSAANYDTMFPPNTPGSGTPGYGGNTGVVSYDGGALLATCDGTSFASAGTWSTFLSAPVGLGQSNYSSTAVDSLVYAVGSNGGTPILAGYNLSGNAVFSISLTSGVVPADVTAGP